MQTTYPAHPLRDLYWMAHDEHVHSGGIVGGVVRELARDGDYADAPRLVRRGPPLAGPHPPLPRPVGR